jgi:hypothetical protein
MESLRELMTSGGSRRFGKLGQFLAQFNSPCRCTSVIGQKLVFLKSGSCSGIYPLAMR